MKSEFLNKQYQEHEHTNTHAQGLQSQVAYFWKLADCATGTQTLTVMGKEGPAPRTQVRASGFQGKKCVEKDFREGPMAKGIKDLCP